MAVKDGSKTLDVAACLERLASGVSAHEEQVTPLTLDCGCVLGKDRPEHRCRYHQAEDDAIYLENQRRLGSGVSIGKADVA